MKALVRAASMGALIVAGAAASAAGPVMAQTAPPASAADTVFRATTLNLSAHGEVRRAPDMATITLGVTTEGATAAEALAANAARMNQVIAALKAGGIEARDIQTSGLNVNPQYVYVENQPPRLTGYRVSNQVTVIVRRLDRLGAAVDAAVRSGATDVGGVSFGIAQPGAAEDAARLEAVKALQAKADLYAKATGYRVARLVTLTEGGGYAPEPPRPMAMRAYADKEAATPVEAGELAVRIEISATFELVK